MHTNTQSKTKIDGLLSDLFTLGRGVPQGCSPNTQSKTKINGLLSDLFTLGRGVPQGCSPSIILHVTAGEVLVISIDADTMIKWVQIGDHETKQEISLIISTFRTIRSF